MSHDNMNVEAVKASLRNAQWRKVKEVEVEGEAGPVRLVVRRVPTERMLALQKDWRQRGLVSEDNQPTGPEQAMEMNRELLAMVLFLPGAVRPLFTAEELMGVSWVDGELLEQVKEAFIPVGKAVEEAQGN